MIRAQGGDISEFYIINAGQFRILLNAYELRERGVVPARNCMCERAASQVKKFF